MSAPLNEYSLFSDEYMLYIHSRQMQASLKTLATVSSEVKCIRRKKTGHQISLNDYYYLCVFKSLAKHYVKTTEDSSSQRICFGAFVFSNLTATTSLYCNTDLEKYTLHKLK